MNNKKKLIGFIVILICLMVICSPLIISCSDSGNPVSEDTIFNLLFPNLWVFIAVLVSATILITTIVWLVWTPFNKKMDERKKFINKEISDAEEAKQNALKNEQESQNELIRTQAEINTMLAKATIKANAIQDEIKHNADAKAALLIENAHQSIESERQQMVDDMHNQIMDIAFSAVTEISKQKITKEENDKLVKEFIDNFDKLSDK